MAKRTVTGTSSELAYVNKTTKTETVSREGRITQTSNADDMRATVGEIICDSESRSRVCFWCAMVVEMANSASSVDEPSELPVRAGNNDLVVIR